MTLTGADPRDTDPSTPTVSRAHGVARALDAGGNDPPPVKSPVMASICPLDGLICFGVFCEL